MGNDATAVSTDPIDHEPWLGLTKVEKSLKKLSITEEVTVKQLLYAAWVYQYQMSQSNSAVKATLSPVKNKLKSMVKCLNSDDYRLLQPIMTRVLILELRKTLAPDQISGASTAGGLGERLVETAEQLLKLIELAEAKIKQDGRQRDAAILHELAFQIIHSLHVHARRIPSRSELMKVVQAVLNGLDMRPRRGSSGESGIENAAREALQKYKSIPQLTN